MSSLRSVIFVPRNDDQSIGVCHPERSRRIFNLTQLFPISRQVHSGPLPQHRLMEYR